MNSSTVFPQSSGLLALLSLLTLVAVRPVLGDTTDTIERTFDVAPGGQLVVDINVGGIEVRGTSGSQVIIEYRRQVSAGSEEQEREILRDHVVTIEQEGNTVSVRATGPGRSVNDSWWRWLLGGGGERRKFHLTVSVPEQFNLELKTRGGGIDVANIEGSVKANTSGGGLEFADIRGDINGRTSGGGIDLDRCHGAVDVHTSGGGISSHDGEGELALDTSGGGITVRRHTGNVRARTSGGGITCSEIAGMIDAHTSGGSVHAEITTLLTGECRLGSSGGGISVTLPANVRATLDAATSGGGVHSDLPVTFTGEHKRNHLQGTINGGGPLIHLRTSGGSIEVREGPATAVAELGR